jgi:glycosyltransferase involved in cell wall biosynthesis
MRASAVFVLPSRYEGLPNVLVEAMACAVPVVATDCPAGSGEIVRHGDNGLLVPVGDAGAMAGAIERVLTEPDLRARLVRGGTTTAEACLMARTVESYESFLLSRVAAR